VDSPQAAHEGGDHVDGARDARRRTGLIIAVLALAIFVSSLDLFIVNLALPYIGSEFAGTTLSSLSWVLNAYTVVFAAVMVPAGRWSDRLGRRRVFVAGLTAFILGRGSPSWGCGA
jgi:MFS family permease